MSFSHLTSSRPSNAASDDAPVTPTSAFAQASIGPGSYLPLANWPGKQSPDVRPVTSFGTSVEPEAPRHARLDRDPSALGGDSYIVREHRELLSRSSDKAERTKKRLESAAARESRSPGRPSLLASIGTWKQPTTKRKTMFFATTIPKLVLFAAAFVGAQVLDVPVSMDVAQAPKAMHRRLTLQTNPPSDPFLMDNRFLGDVSVESHPIFGSASVEITSSGLFRAATTVGTGGAPIAATWIPTATDASAFVDTGDVLYINSLELRSVVAVNRSGIQVDRGLQFALLGQESLSVKRALFSASEGGAPPIASVNALGLEVHSTDVTTDTAGTHTTVRLVHYSTGNASSLVRVPGTATVTQGSTLVGTSTSLASVLSANTYIRLAGATYIVTAPPSASSIVLDRPFAGPSFTGIPMYIESLGAGIELKAVGADNVTAAAGIEAVFGTDVPTLRLATASSNATNGGLTTRVHVSVKGVTLVGGANTIATEFGGLSLKAASFVTVQAGTDEASGAGGDVAMNAGIKTRRPCRELYRSCPPTTARHLVS
ncbi:hypothetical protein SDRG_15903 [Saprolegnia diclina VS20]|uniref:Uncharacterized protein n=1 Tax=Saprolegnia diclina (strain VS20) TaxID=1156394 RepID=T0R9P9_SAPDV|nr:hypothetical protein SDRG_15903 [Saprolegnia diclina VS20]EQC26242.1 hypothetical protein SDRG_15903 [Saprolegnia diclina VS20]|eukprot:XP_008620311.1 hypothetical protein SDRG_15903 [Saprolegnia diclina VS20]